MDTVGAGDAFMAGMPA
ncbi:hypothetical protein [Streptomyces sp. NPDC048142]